MGAVWLAERSDGEFHQKVAIKFLAAGASRPGWRQRFVRERQLLALLNHPAIVHLIDAGRTAEGRPYLVMEYVEGRSIDVYAADLPIESRLRLFLKVCEGVSHAHRHLIIHRDLKPSNILVDAAGQPKLLDFGIAKLLDETGDPTKTLERTLTPQYASPEQLSGGPQTTSTDVYSLGAVLFTLATGRIPHDTSNRTADRQHSSVPKDLDCILRKALRVELEERYPSVDALADDIRSLLDGRPVAARSGDVWSEIGAAYLQVARIQGVPGGVNLGDFEQADQTLVKAEQLVDPILKEDPDNRPALRTSAEISHDRMVLANSDSAERQIAEARKTRTRLAAFLGRGPASTDETINAAHLLTDVALFSKNAGHPDEGVRAAQQAIEIVRPLDTKDALRVRGRAFVRLAELLRRSGDPGAALVAIREARPVVEAGAYPSDQERTYAVRHLQRRSLRARRSRWCQSRPHRRGRPGQAEGARTGGRARRTRLTRFS
jgi:serine/threonine protein kinase